MTPPGARRSSRYRSGPYEGRVFKVIARDHDQTGTALDRRLEWRRLVAAFDVSLIAGTHPRCSTRNTSMTLVEGDKRAATRSLLHRGRSET